MALSNGASSSNYGLLKGGGLDGFIEEVFSVEDVKLSKPRREVYLHVAQTLSVEPVELALVAAHAWDSQGGWPAGGFRRTRTTLSYGDAAPTSKAGS